MNDPASPRPSMRPRPGRPKATSQDDLAEAACELFLEQGYPATSISDIARRAGVSRSSFFNYFDSKSAILWSGLDARIEGCLRELATNDDSDAASVTRRAITGIARGFNPDYLALAWRNASAMGILDEVEREAAVRQSRLAHAIAARLRGAGAESIWAEVRGAAWAATVFAALRAWSASGAVATDLSELVTEAIGAVEPDVPPR